MILYLHGFRSSPLSTKARLLAQALEQRGRADDYLCPQLPVSPRHAAELVLAAAELESPGALTVVGSSLGGYYATWLAERTGCRAVLLNPAIRPYEDLAAHLGAQTVFHSDEIIEVRPEHLDELRALDTPRITRPERYRLLAATGDAVIDWRTMVAKYAGCEQLVIEGSDHEISDFAVHLPRVLAWCGID